MLPSSLPNQKQAPTSRGNEARICEMYDQAVCWVEMGRSLKYSTPSTLKESGEGR